MSLRAYPKYKESGIEWLGQVPQHWEVKRLKDATSYISRGSSPDYADESSIRVLNQACVHVDGIRQENAKFHQEAEVTDWPSRLLKNDLLVNSTGTGTLGRVALFELEGTWVADSHVTIVRTLEDNFLAKFCFYVLSCSFYQGYIYAALVNGSTNQIELSRERLRQTALLLLPLPEQRAIAAFLDRETARLDTLIAKQERLIELSMEKRRALISHAVTRGLDASAPLKDSGVEWLGQVPQHWEVKRVSSCSSSLQTGPFGSQLHSEDYVSDGTPIINPSHLRAGRINPDFECTVDDETKARLTQHCLEAGDVVFARRGELGRCGLVTAAEVGWLCGTGSLRMRPTEVCDPWYLLHLLSTSGVAEWLSLQSVGATMENLNTTILSRLPLLLPPLSEQRAIVKYLDGEAAKIDTLIAKARRSIELMKEHRASLIAAAVTGKIDVRERVGAA